MTGTNYTALICITSCNRLTDVKKYVFDYISFCNSNINFHFLLALDGCNNEYISFCSEYCIPLLFSDEREGVGASKNRVILKFPNYDYYFFIEDDAELVSTSVFENHITLSKKHNIPHFSLSKLNFTELNNNTVYRYFQKDNLGFSMYGGAVFNFFERSALQKVGGWHISFAKYKRYGHTEHTYRFFNLGLTPYPFIFLLDEESSFIWHDPPHVSKDIKNNSSISGIIDDELKLMSEKLSNFPFQSNSKYYFNDFDMNYNKTVAEFLQKHKKHYPLAFGKERRKALAEYYFEKFLRRSGFFAKSKHFLLSLINNPFNIPFKHFLKTKLHLK